MGRHKSLSDRGYLVPEWDFRGELALANGGDLPSVLEEVLLSDKGDAVSKW